MTNKTMHSKSHNKTKVCIFVMKQTIQNYLTFTKKTLNEMSVFLYKFYGMVQYLP